MDTAKVDIRKLQLLNDRINQCLDALNQVRFSVYGLSHSAGAPFNAVGWGPAPASPYGFQDPRFSSPTPAGLSHTPYNPAAALGQGAFGIPATGWVPGGLSHTGPELDAGFRQVTADPFLAGRIVQTFPYAQLAIPPVMAIP